MAQAHIIDPVSQIDDIIGVFGVDRDMLESLVCLQLHEVIVFGFFQILEVDIDESENEILSVLMFQGQFLEALPVEIIRVPIESLEDDHEHVVQVLLTAYWQLGEFFWLYFADGFLDASAHGVDVLDFALYLLWLGFEDTPWDLTQLVILLPLLVDLVNVEFAFLLLIPHCILDIFNVLDDILKLWNSNGSVPATSA